MDRVLGRVAFVTYLGLPSQSQEGLPSQDCQGKRNQELSKSVLIGSSFVVSQVILRCPFGHLLMIPLFFLRLLSGRIWQDLKYS